MKRSQHTEHCRQILGEGFLEVHDYLDQYHDTMGPDHRSVLHNLVGIANCIERWGYKGGAAACLHIWADEVGLIMTNDGKFQMPIIMGDHKQPQPSPQEQANVHIEHYFPKGYDSNAEPWKGIKTHHNAELERAYQKGKLDREREIYGLKDK